MGSNNYLFTRQKLSLRYCVCGERTLPVHGPRAWRHVLPHHACRAYPATSCLRSFVPLGADSWPDLASFTCDGAPAAIVRLCWLATASCCGANGGVQSAPSYCPTCARACKECGAFEAVRRGSQLLLPCVHVLAQCCCWPRTGARAHTLVCPCAHPPRTHARAQARMCARAHATTDATHAVPMHAATSGASHACAHARTRAHACTRPVPMQQQQVPRTDARTHACALHPRPPPPSPTPPPSC